MSERDEILSALPNDEGALVSSAATFPDALAEPTPTIDAPAMDGRRDDVSPVSADVSAADLWQRFIEIAEPLGARVVRLESLDIAGKSVYVDEDARRWLAHNCDDVWQADVGVTSADVAVAETGSLLIANGPGRARLTSLAPPSHIAIVNKNDIVATLDDAMRRLTGRTCVLITGSSRTADIEGITVRGVHGPGELVIAIIEEP